MIDGAAPLDASTGELETAGRYGPAWISGLRRHGDLAALTALMLLTATAAWERFSVDTWIGRVDVLTAYLPWYDLVGKTLGSFRLPGWNPYTFSGTPLAGDPQSGWMYAPVMLWFAILPAVAAFKAMVLTQLVVAGVSTYALARLVGMGPIGALTAAASFEFGPFLLQNSYCCTIYPQVTTWFPLAFVGVELAVRRRSWAGRIAAWGVAGFAISQIAAGWVGQGAYNGFLLVAGYVFYRTALAPLHAASARRRASRLVLHGVGVFGLGLAMAAAGLLPRLDVNGRTNLAGGYDNVAAASGKGWKLDYLFFQVLNSGGATARFYVGGATIALALLALPLVRRRSAVPYFAAFTAALMVMTLDPTPLHRLLYLLPRYQSLHEHTPFRVLGLMMLGPAMLAGATVDAIARRRPPMWAPIVAFLPLVTVEAARGYVIDHGRRLPPLPLTVIVATLIAAGGLALGLPWLREHAPRLAIARYAAPLLLVALLLWDPWFRFFLDSVRNGTVPARSETSIAVNTATSDPGGAGEFLRGELARGGEPFRYFGYDALGLRTLDPSEFLDQTGGTYHSRRDRPNIQALLVSARAMRLGLYDIQGYNPIQLSRYVDYFRALTGVSQNYHDANVQPGSLDSPLIDLLNVRYVVIPNDAPPGRPRTDLLALRLKHREVFRNARIRVLANDAAFPRAWIVHEARQVSEADSLGEIANGSVDPRVTALVERAPPPLKPAAAGVLEQVQVTGYEPDLVRLSATLGADGMIVLDDVYDDGWRVYVDGEREQIYVADHLLRGAAVPAGIHTVEFRYEPLPLRVGLALSGAALAIVAASLALLGWHRWSSRDGGRALLPKVAS
ncbi:MAG: YfhO family protein [Thermomicrobiales bacterium]